ncbi:MAG: hypothetical protein KF883_17135 [Thermomicrobiales bacterium]|nr:hypothetical protein [Thermomicrobiales bacterium]
MIRRIGSYQGRTLSRRAFTGGVMGAAGLAAIGGQRLTSAQDGGAATEGRYLLVADPAEAAVFIYSIPDHTLTGRLDNVVFGVHNGLIGLPDGRLIFSDDTSGEVLAVTVDEAGVPSIAQRVAVNAGRRLVWSSLDPALSWYVGASQIEESSTQVANVVDLTTFTNTAYEIEMAGEEELHVWVAGDPAYLYASVAGEIHSFLLDDMQERGSAPADILAIDPGSHGAVADGERSQFALVSNSGFEVTDVSDGPATYKGSIPWDVDGFAGGRNARPRLHPDGTHIFGRLNPNPESPEQWAEVEVTTHIANLADLTARRFALGHGNFAFRVGVSDPYVLFAGHDGVTGAAYVVDADSASETFGTPVQTIELPLPTGAGTPGEDSAGTQGYLTALTGDGSLGYVVHGGDGIISVIDTAAGAVAGTIEVPAPLTGGGYATVVELGATPVDLFAR